jgi:hypothetical protein
MSEQVDLLAGQGASGSDPGFTKLNSATSSGSPVLIDVLTWASKTSKIAIWREVTVGNNLNWEGPGDPPPESHRF